MANELEKYQKEVARLDNEVVSANLKVRNLQTKLENEQKVCGVLPY
jgi:hypothetical protein